VDTPPAAPKGHGRISPWRAGISPTLAKKAWSDPDVKAGLARSETIIDITVVMPEIRAEVTDDLEDGAWYKNDIAIHPVAPLQFLRRRQQLLAAIAAIGDPAVIGVAC
jgi:hypothetical protein